MCPEESEERQVQSTPLAVGTDEEAGSREANKPQAPQDPEGAGRKATAVVFESLSAPHPLCRVPMQTSEVPCLTGVMPSETVARTLRF